MEQPKGTDTRIYIRVSNEKAGKLKALIFIMIVAVVLGCEEEISPEVLKISPAAGETMFDSQLTVLFNKSMDPTTIEITVGGVSGEIASNEKRTQFVWTQKRGRVPTGLQRVMISGRDEEGNSLIGYQPISVNVIGIEWEPIAIVEVIPPLNAPVSVNTTQMVVSFSEPVDPSESNIKVTSRKGKTIGIATSWNTYNATITFLETLTRQTTYTVTFLNLLDIAAFRTPEVQFTFTTKGFEEKK